MRMLLGMCMGWLWLKRGIGEIKQRILLLLLLHFCMFLLSALLLMICTCAERSCDVCACEIRR